MSTPLLILVKAVNGGLFVALFAVIGEILQPKRFAGIFGASPAVALANLLVIALAKGDTSARDAATGMMAGAIALAVGCAAAIPAVRRWGAVGGSALLWGVWFIVGGATAIPIAGTGAAAAAGLPVGRGARRRPKSGGTPDSTGDSNRGSSNGSSEGSAEGRLFAVDFRAVREIRPKDLAVRFAFGAAVSIVAGLIGVAAGQRLGGVMLAAPAVLPATLTIIEKKEGRGPAVTEVQGSVPGAIALIGFALVATVSTAKLRLAGALLLALATWVAAAIVGYLVQAAILSAWRQDVRDIAFQRRDLALTRRAQAALGAQPSGSRS